MFTSLTGLIDGSNVAHMSPRVVEDVYVRIGQRIRELRTARSPRVSQARLANDVGLSRVSMANIERGRHRVQVHVLYAIARVLSVSVTELLPTAHTASQAGTASVPASLARHLKRGELPAVQQLIRSAEARDGR